MLYKFMFSESEVLTINEALDYASIWSENELLSDKAIDKLQSYIRNEIETQSKLFIPDNLLDKLK